MTAGVLLAAALGMTAAAGLTAAPRRLRPPRHLLPGRQHEYPHLGARARWCPSVSGCLAPTTRRRWPSAPTTRGRRGDAAGARDQYAALLPIRERVLGPDHRDTLAARDNLAYWTGEADRSGN